MTDPVLIILHQEQSTPGRVGHLLRIMGHALDIRRPPLGDRLPDDLTSYAGVVVFGGPMSANDHDPWIVDEMACIDRALKAETPFLGLCLGAQMLCRMLGTRVSRHPEQAVEIGYYPIKPTDEGARFADALGVAWPRHVYHWHREGFDIPEGAVALATGDVFANQAFQIGKSAFGLQFHPEVTYSMICRWTVKAHDRMQDQGARPPHEHRADWYRFDHDVNTWLRAFLPHWLRSGARVAPPRDQSRSTTPMKGSWR